jgi:hypothetical protein
MREKVKVFVNSKTTFLEIKETVTLVTVLQQIHQELREIKEALGK